MESKLETNTTEKSTPRNQQSESKLGSLNRITLSSNSKLNEKDIQFYDENGYIILRNVIPTKILDEVNNFMASVIKLEAQRNNIPISESTETLLNKTLIELRKKNSTRSSWVFETINQSSVVKNFFYRLGLEEIIKNLLHMDSAKNLGTVQAVIRTDEPFDTLHARVWHQDSNYFLDTKSGRDFLVVWIPFQACNEKNGAAIVCPRSHNEGRLNTTHVKAEIGKSEQYIIPSDKVANYDKVTLVCEPGDIVFFNNDIIHRSGHNRSNMVRYTGQIRYCNLAKEGYRPPRHILEYPEY